MYYICVLPWLPICLFVDTYEQRKLLSAKCLVWFARFRTIITIIMIMRTIRSVVDFEVKFLRTFIDIYRVNVWIWFLCHSWMVCGVTMGIVMQNGMQLVNRMIKGEWKQINTALKCFWFFGLAGLIAIVAHQIDSVIRTESTLQSRTHIIPLAFRNTIRTLSLSEIYNCHRISKFTLSSMTHFCYAFQRQIWRENRHNIYS